MDHHFLHKPFKVILTDDDADDREMFELALKETGLPCEFRSFPNGMALLTYLEDDRYEMPDIIFLDLNMPILDGISALLKIRALEKCTSVPTIAIYSTSSNVIDVRETFNSGANLYITKPNDFGSLIRMLEKIIPNCGHLSALPATIDSFCFRLT